MVEGHGWARASPNWLGKKHLCNQHRIPLLLADTLPCFAVPECMAAPRSSHCRSFCIRYAMAISMEPPAMGSPSPCRHPVSRAPLSHGARAASSSPREVSMRWRYMLPGQRLCECEGPWPCYVIHRASQHNGATAERWSIALSSSSAQMW
jgi:hypothetical protein